MKTDHLIEETYNQLKDFQRKTVDYAVERFSNRQTRFLIADEVGLGKTIVAKGIIAKLYQREVTGNKSFSVVYICSNKALAKQNLAKLSFVKRADDKDFDADKVIDYSEADDRISALAYEPLHGPNKYKLQIKALTPATSFDNNTYAGKADERVLLYRIISKFEEFRQRKTALKWFLRGNRRIGLGTWEEKISTAEKYTEKNLQGLRKIRDNVGSKFYTALKKKLPIADYRSIYNALDIDKETSLLNILLSIIKPNKQNRSFFDTNSKGIMKDKPSDCFKPFKSLISELRFQLSLVCKEYLKADLFILDEFQRYSRLIDTEKEADDPGTFLAKSIFSKPGVRVLMLSATPFKTYTNSYDELQGENHFAEFRRVLAFLLTNHQEEFWKLLDEENYSYFKLLRNLQKEDTDLDELARLKNKIELKYRSCIARTERTLVEVPTEEYIDNSVKLLKVNKEDIIDFITTDEIIKALDNVTKNKLPIPVEYVKSSPFPFSFLHDYEHMKVLEEEFSKNIEIRKIIKNARRALLSEERVIAYKALLPEKIFNEDNEPNPKLRLLYDETVRNKGWKLLWVPASVKYYNVSKGAYVNSEDFTKTLIFSAWKMVPRMVSALVSYEAERRSVGKFLEKKKAGEEYKYTDKRRYPYPLLTFKNTDQKFSGMNNFMLAYPSLYLASCYSPANNLLHKKTLGEIRSVISNTIKSRLLKLNVLSMGDASGDVQKWDWYAVFLLDKHEQGFQFMNEWAMLGFDASINLYENEDEKTENGSAGKRSHFEEMRRCITNEGYKPNLGKLKEPQLNKLCEHLTDLCLGSPAVSSMRSFNATYSSNSLNSMIKSAYNIGMGFISMFNKPESIAIVSEFENENSYSKNVLKYCIGGNIQSMLDEFVYQLQDSSGMEDSIKCAEFIRDILTVNSGSMEVKTANSFENKSGKSGFNIRTHYAIPFGLGSGSELKNGVRQIKVREAFNSPFRPFVLTSTSIGQEGLDFHYYCSKLIHWNLPTNPIDLEQREGRIKRFKGLNIRKKVAADYTEKLTQIDRMDNVWNNLFKLAEQNKPSDKCDLIPFWHLDGNGQHDIQTIIPIYEYSKDFDKLKYIKNVLANYRLTFGQPRQEELIYILGEINKSAETKRKFKDLSINLCPLTYSNG